ncbi:MAG: FAD-dependent oxidoreductase [Flavobacteriaceae bacterium]|nr:MAG: FAD-dependent oxidoreductase [Flavobacteriaceae bacterium]
MNKFDVIIVGGGLAGLTAALDLTKRGFTVLVFEKQRYPHHKVCGEYVSNEIQPYLEHLGVFLDQANAVVIDTFQLSTVKGKSLKVKLPIGGKGISRHAFDYLLYKNAISKGVTFVFENVDSIAFKNGAFTVKSGLSETYMSTLVIGAYGKRSSLDKQLHRGFIQDKSSWLGVKAHYKLDSFPDNLVALHNFRGGYGGLSKTETGVINFCYLVSYESFKQEKKVVDFNKNVLVKNPFLATFLKEAIPLFDQPLSIAQISFQPKKAVENHVLMCGDTASLIHPLCGNGMAMAMHSSKIACEIIQNYMDGIYDRTYMEKEYQKQWTAVFKRRLWAGKQLQKIMLREDLSNFAMGTVAKSPRLLKSIISKTHGKPVIC